MIAGTDARTRKWPWGWALLVLALAWPAAARAQAIDQAWKRGNDATFKGDYDTALAAYVELDRAGVVSADLFYNLGVAYYRKDDLGRAIWSFERAVALDPEAEDARFNLAQARKLAARRADDKLEGAEREPLWIRAVTALTTSTQTWMFLVLYLGCFALLFVRRRAAEDHRAPLSAAAALLGVGAAVIGLMLFGRATLDRLPFGIVLPGQVAVKEGADPNYRTSFEVHAGLKLRLLDQEHGWVRVRLANGLEGWVREDTVGRL
jgi:tetratricopeptide (TPR) repeat protein